MLGFVLCLCLNLLWCQPVSLNWSTDPNTTCQAQASYVPYIVTIGFRAKPGLAADLEKKLRDRVPISRTEAVVEPAAPLGRDWRADAR